MAKTVGIILNLKDKCSPGLKKIAEGMGMTEAQAKKLHRQTSILSKELGAGIKKAATVCATAVGAVAVASQQLITRTMEAGDHIDKMSQKIGMSRQAFQKWDYIMSQSGASIDQMQTGMKTLSQKMVDSTKSGSEASKIFKRLGVTVKDSSGNFKSQEQAFTDVVKALQKMPDGVEKANMAQKLFGRTGSELRPLLNGVRGNVDELSQKFDKLGMGMSDKQVDACVKLTDTFDTLNRAVGAMFNQIGADYLPTIQKFADTFIDNMPKIKSAVLPVINAITGVFTFMIKHTKLLTVATVTCIGTIMAYKTITQVITIVNLFRETITMAGGAMKLFNFIMLQNPIMRTVTAIGLLIAVVATLALNWDKVTKACSKAFNAVKRFVGLNPKVNTPDVNMPETDTVKPKHHALGTSFSTGGLAVVGEQGAELVNLKRGDSVTPHNKTEQILNNNSKDIKVNVNIAGNIIGIDNFVEQVKTALALELNTALAVT